MRQKKSPDKFILKTLMQCLVIRTLKENKPKLIKEIL